MAGDTIKNLGDANFKDYVTTSDKPVLVDFWADWCGPCKMIAPVVEEIAADYLGKVSVAKVNVDENRAIPAEYKINSIPTLIMFKSGKEVERFIGFKTKKELKTIIDKHMA